METIPSVNLMISGTSLSGKTAIFNRIKYNQFITNNKCSLLSHYYYRLCIINHITVRLTIYKMSMHYQSMTDSPSIIFLLYDMSDKESLEKIKTLYNDTRIRCNSNPIILIGNKRDRKRDFDSPMITNFCIDNDVQKYELSCLTGEHIYELLFLIIKNSINSVLNMEHSFPKLIVNTHNFYICLLY